MLKKIAPKKILPRLLLIFLLPLILTQCLLIFIFYDRHWDKIITRFVNIASNQVGLLMSDYNLNGLISAQKNAVKLNLKFLTFKEIPTSKKIKSYFEVKIEKKIRNRLGDNYSVVFEDNEVIIVKKNNNILLIKFPKKYLLSETPTILFLWMISSSLLLSLIAFLFLRIQIRAIQRLANSARDFGEGKKIKRFKPEGALEIRQAGSAFIQMKRKINKYFLQRTSFLAGISHDLGTILTRIKLRLELISEDSDIKFIKKDIKTMEMFLKEYLDFSEKVQVSRLSKVNIYNLILEVVNSSKSLKKKVTVFCKKDLLFMTDQNCLYRVIFNLCENASNHSEKIFIKVSNKNRLMQISIEDNGPGIPDKFKKKVFKPFFRIDNSRNLNKAGSGLGLSIANELVKKLKGKIIVRDSTKLKGSIFTIQL